MTFFQKLNLTIIFLVELSSSLSFGIDVSSWPITSVGANSKLVLRTNFIVSANQNGTTWNGGEHFLDAERMKAFACHIFTRETSLDSRVLRAGTEIQFTGEVSESLYSESDEGSIKCYDFNVSQPDGVDRLHCIAFTFYQGEDGKLKVKPREATIGEVIRFFKDGADLVMSEPVEIGNP